MVVFHEQVLRVIDVMTGCGLAEADLVRRHLSKEGGPERTAPWFRAQALARGFDPVTVERVWQVVAAFGGFGFCKAHAAAFAIPVYQSAWLRRHHPAAFYAGVLTHDPGMYPKRVIIADARLSGVQILPVDINASSADWTERQKIHHPERLQLSSRPPISPPAARTTARPAPACRPGHPRAGRSAARSRSRPPTADRSPLAGSLSSPARSRRSVPGRRGDDPPYPPMSARPGLIAKIAIVSGLPARTVLLRSPRRRSAAPSARSRASATPRSPALVSGQPYTSLRDFWNRAGVSRPVAERLVLIGALDSLYTPAPNLVPADLAPAPAPADSASPAAQRYTDLWWDEPGQAGRVPAQNRYTSPAAPTAGCLHRQSRHRRSPPGSPPPSQRSRLPSRRTFPICRASVWRRDTAPRQRRTPPGGTCLPGSGCSPGSPTRPGTGHPH